MHLPYDISTDAKTLGLSLTKSPADAKNTPEEALSPRYTPRSQDA